MDKLLFKDSHPLEKLKSGTLQQVLYTGSLFKEVDSNLDAWLEQDIPGADESVIYSYELTKPLDNKQLLLGISGTTSPKMTIGQVRRFIESPNSALVKNGFSNLFVVTGKESQDYIVGVVYDESIDSFVPYIYRTRNIYRAWNKGNRLHIAEKI